MNFKHCVVNFVFLFLLPIVFGVPCFLELWCSCFLAPQMHNPWEKRVQAFFFWWKWVEFSQVTTTLVQKRRDKSWGRKVEGIAWGERDGGVARRQGRPNWETLPLLLAVGCCFCSVSGWNFTSGWHGFPRVQSFTCSSLGLSHRGSMCKPAGLGQPCRHTGALTAEGQAWF